jgi:hypothetical protein
MVFSLWLWPTMKSVTTKMQANQRQFRWPWRFSGTMRGASLDGAHSGLHSKPMDAAIGRVPAPYRPDGGHGRQI